MNPWHCWRADQRHIAYASRALRPFDVYAIYANAPLPQYSLAPIPVVTIRHAIASTVSVSGAGNALFISVTVSGRLRRLFASLCGSTAVTASHSGCERFSVLRTKAWTADRSKLNDRGASP